MAIGKPIIEDWLRGILADPTTKIPCSVEDFPVVAVLQWLARSSVVLTSLSAWASTALLL